MFVDKDYLIIQKSSIHQMKHLPAMERRINRAVRFVVDMQRAEM